MGTGTKYRSINEIMAEDVSKVSNLRLIGKTASDRGSKTFLVPCYFDMAYNRWLCIDNHHNGSRKILNVQWRSGTTKRYKVLDEPYYVVKTHGCLSQLISMADSLGLIGRSHNIHERGMDIIEDALIGNSGCSVGYEEDDDGMTYLGDDVYVSVK